MQVDLGVKRYTAFFGVMVPHARDINDYKFYRSSRLLMFFKIGAL